MILYKNEHMFRLGICWIYLPTTSKSHRKKRNFPRKNVSLPGANRYRVRVRSTVEETQLTPKAKSGEERAAEVSSALGQ